MGFRARAATTIFCFSLLFLASVPLEATVTFDWVVVGAPGNAGDTETMTCCGSDVGTSGYGSVGYVYRISRVEVTWTQYAEFLNAVAVTDTYGLYSGGLMDGNDLPGTGGITRTGSQGSYSYQAIAGLESKPAIYVPWFNAARFINWLHNGQPTGLQDATTTEDGVYTLGQHFPPDDLPRNPVGTLHIPTEDEWYKAAYYDTQTDTWYDYPTSSDTAPACLLPPLDSGNTINCFPAGGGSEGLSTPTGAYTLTVSPNGTFDQGGNAWEWTEAVDMYSNRVVRGGAFDQGALESASSRRHRLAAGDNNDLYVGFRVAETLGMGPGRSSGLTIDRGAGTELTLSWSLGCSVAATDYAIYEGLLGDWDSHESVACTDTTPYMTETFEPDAGDSYYLVVPLSGTDEGSHGLSTDGGTPAERSMGVDACRVEQTTACP